MVRSTTARWALVAVAAAALAACSGGDDGAADLPTIAVDPTAPPPSTSPATDATPSSAGTTTVTTDAAASTTTDPSAGPMFSDDLGVRVDTAPGVNTRGDTRQLMPEGLYVHIAWEPDPNDPSVFTVQPEDVEILEAYANAVATYYRAATTTLSLESPDFAKYFVDAGAKYEASFTQARSGGYALAIGTAVVLRPYVLADQRSETAAVVLDCYLAEQEFLPVGSPLPAVELSKSPTLATMTKGVGGWQVDLIATEQQACF